MTGAPTEAEIDAMHRALSGGMPVTYHFSRPQRPCQRRLAWCVGVTTFIATVIEKWRYAKVPQWFEQGLKKAEALPAADDDERFIVCERFIAERINGSPTLRQRTEALAAYRLTAWRLLYRIGLFDVDGRKDRIRLLLQNATAQDLCGLAGLVLRAGREMPLPEGLFDEVTNAALFVYTCITGDTTYGLKPADAQDFGEQATEQQLAALKEARENGPFGFSNERLAHGFSYIIAAIRAERTIVYACPPMPDGFSDTSTAA
jgi:hypothetical protein